MPEFPLDLLPGEYQCEWQRDGRTIDGAIELRAGLPPALTLYGDVVDVDVSDGAVHAFPQEHDLPRLTARLRSNREVVVADAALSTWFPGRTNGFARYAIVGLGVADVADDRYERVRLQITGSERLFGVAPLKSASWPKTLADPEPFSASYNLDCRLTWQDKTVGLTIDCWYEMRMPAPDPFRFQVTSVPIVEFEAEDPLTLDEWVERWIQPLVRIFAFATGQRQGLAWLTLHRKHDDREISGVVFAVGIDQAPYEARSPEPSPEPEHRAFFTFDRLPTSLPNLLVHVRTLESSDNPFVELYRSALLQADLPSRARFLHLVQALEGLHGYENRAADERAQGSLQEDPRHPAIRDPESRPAVQPAKSAEEKVGHAKAR